MKKKNKKKKTSRSGSKRSVASSVERITTWLSEHGGKRVVRNLADPVRGQIPPGVPEDLGELWQIHDGQKRPDHSMFPDGLIFFSSKNSRLSEDDVEHYLALQYWAKLPPEEQRSLRVNLRPREQQCREWFAIAVRDKMGLFVCGASGRVVEAEAGGGYQKIYPSLADFLAKYAEELERGTCVYDSSMEEIERISTHEKQRRARLQKKVNLGKQVSKLWPRLNALGQLRLEPIELGDGFNLGLISSMKGSDVLLTLANALEANARSRIATHYVTHYEFGGEFEESLYWTSHCFLAEHLIKKEFESILLEEFKPEPVWKSGHVAGPIAALLDEAGRRSKNWAVAFGVASDTLQLRCMVPLRVPKTYKTLVELNDMNKHSRALQIGSSQPSVARVCSAGGLLGVAAHADPNDEQDVERAIRELTEMAHLLIERGTNPTPDARTLEKLRSIAEKTVGSITGNPL